MNLTDTIIPRSDQMNAEDFLVGPRTFTIASVSAGNAEQPVNIGLVEEPERAYRPGKSMRRVLVSAWGPDTDCYVGRRMTLYCDPSVKWAGQEVGGIRLSHLSHIDKPLKLALTTTRGKKDPFIVQPLADEAPTIPAITRQQLDQLASGFRALNITDAAKGLDFIQRTINREVNSSKDLNSAEASSVIEAIAAIVESNLTPDDTTPPQDEPAFEVLS